MALLWIVEQVQQILFSPNTCFLTENNRYQRTLKNFLPSQNKELVWRLILLRELMYLRSAELNVSDSDKNVNILLVWNERVPQGIHEVFCS